MEPLTQREAAEVAGLSRRHLRRLDTSDDPPPRDGEGRYPPREFGRWLQRRIVSESGTLDLDAERARLAKEQADKIAMENARRREILVDSERVREWWRAIVTTARKRLLVIPKRVAPNVMGAASLPAVRDVLETEIYAALNELSGTVPDDSGTPLDSGVQ